MDPIYVPVLSALAGALIGSLSSIGTIYIQARISSRRERIKQAVELAIEDHRAAREIAKMSNPGRTLMLPPITAFLHYHEEVLRALDAGPLTTNTLREIRNRNKAIMAMFEEITNEGRK
jgi:hypothetical protein